MTQKNVYKPRYKVAFQAKSKIWPYKSSRLRRFFNIRGRKLVRRGYFKRYIVVFNNMKWTVARRYIRPATRRRKAVRRRFREAFYTKQQLRLFHGKFKEQAFREFFKRFLLHTNNRNRSFFAALERRIDIFFFRMRLLPTIFACHQYIHHHGILINRRLEKSPNALISVGDTVTIQQKKHWRAFFWYMYDRIFYRLYGKRIAIKRNFVLIKKKTWWLRKKIRHQRWMFDLGKRRLFLNIFLLKQCRKFIDFLKLFILRVEDFLDSLEGLGVDLTNNESQTRKLTISRISTYLEKIVVRMNKLYVSYRSLLMLQRRSNRLVKKRARHLYLPYKFRMRNVYRTVIYLVGSLVNGYLRSRWLVLKMEWEEFRFYTFLLPTIEGTEREKDLKAFIKEKRKTMLYGYHIWRKKLIRYYSLFLRKLIRKQTLRAYFRYNPQVKREVPRANRMTFFCLNRRYKKLRRRRISRLKSIHWAVPCYIHIDFRTLRGVLLYSPVPKEIHHSFRCSLTRIASFYKSLAL